MRKFVIIFGVLFFLFFGAYQLVRLKRIAKTDYSLFNSKKLEGKIVNISYSGGLSFIELDNMEEKFSFMPVPLSINKDKFFYLIAEPTDSLLKMQNSDTLILVHKGHKYFYTFNKFK